VTRWPSERVYRNAEPRSGALWCRGRAQQPAGVPDLPTSHLALARSESGRHAHVPHRRGNGLLRACQVLLCLQRAHLSWGLSLCHRPPRWLWREHRHAVRVFGPAFVPAPSCAGRCHRGGGRYPLHPVPLFRLSQPVHAFMTLP